MGKHILILLGADAAGRVWLGLVLSFAFVMASAAASAQAPGVYPIGEHAARLQDQRDDVEFWNGLVLLGGPSWGATSQGDPSTRSADLTGLSLLFLDSDKLALMGPSVNATEAMWCPPADGNTAYWIDVHFLLSGVAHSIKMDTEQCTGRLGQMVLWRGEERLADLEPLGWIRPWHFGLTAGSWPKGTTITDVNASILRRESSAPCDADRVGTDCGGHWRDRVPDQGVARDFRIVAPSADEPPTTTTSPEGTDAPVPGWAVLMAIAVALIVHARRRPPQDVPRQRRTGHRRRA